MGTKQSQSDTLTNTGGSSLTLSQANMTGAGFSISGLNLPATLAAGESTSVSLTVSPQTPGAMSGTLALTSDASSIPLSISVSATAIAAGSLVTNPSSFSFGGVQLGANQSQTETLTNSGGENLTVTAATASDASFSVTGLALPLTLVPGQSSTFAVVFAPTSAGNLNGLLSLSVSGTSSTYDLALSGAGFAPASLSASPSALTFSSVEVGKSQTQTISISNSGGASATVSADSISGSGFSLSGASLPLTLAAGQKMSFNVIFAPLKAGTVSGSVAVDSNASDSVLNISLAGTATGVPLGQLSVSPATMSFGNVTVGQSGVQSGSLSASGASVTVSSIGTGSSEFLLSGLNLPVVIPAGQSVSFSITFTPNASGLAFVTASYASDASNAPGETLTGTGVAATVYSVALSWNPSTSPNISGYNVYRRSGSSGNFTKINGSLDAATGYSDFAVADGQTYYYETTAVNGSGEESVASASIAATIPSH